MKKIDNFFHYDKWLSKILKKKTYSILNPSISIINYPKKIDFAYIKVEKNNKKLLEFFVKEKFKKINSNITFEKKIKFKKKPLIQNKIS